MGNGKYQCQNLLDYDDELPSRHDLVDEEGDTCSECADRAFQRSLNDESESLQEQYQKASELKRSLAAKLESAGIPVTAGRIRTSDLKKAIAFIVGTPDMVQVAEHDFKMPKLKLKTGDTSKIGLIEVDGKMMTIEELQNLKEVKGDLGLSDLGLTELPDLSHLKVGGRFDCSSNELTSLQGAPKEVVGEFYCYANNLTSLQGAPQEVGGDFWCYLNKLTSLQGAPKEVGGDFYCDRNELTSLQGAPKEVVGNFYSSNNKLTSLKGAPKKVDGGFYCNYNLLTSLQGAPKVVIGEFICYDNLLTSLQGAPRVVGGQFDCSYNQLTSLEGAPEKVGGYFKCSDNKKKFTEKDVRGVSNVGSQVWGD